MAGLGQFKAGTGIFSPTGFLKSKALTIRKVGTSRNDGGTYETQSLSPFTGIIGVWWWKQVRVSI